MKRSNLLAEKNKKKNGKEGKQTKQPKTKRHKYYYNNEFRIKISLIQIFW